MFFNVIFPVRRTEQNATKLRKFLLATCTFWVNHIDLCVLVLRYYTLLYSDAMYKSKPQRFPDDNHPDPAGGHFFVENRKFAYKTSRHAVSFFSTLTLQR